MKAYGKTRRDAMSCPYGCCQWKGAKMKVCREVVDKSRRKKARRNAKKDVMFSLVVS